MTIRKALIFFFSGIFSFLSSQISPDKRVVSPQIHPGLKFTENLGQWPANILLRAQIDGGAVFLEANKLSFNFYDKKQLKNLHLGKASSADDPTKKIRGHAYQIEFEGCKPDARLEKLQAGTDYENFFVSSDRNTWKSQVKNYRQLWLRELYTKIDYELFTAINGLKYNFHVKPGGNVNDVKLRYKGVEKLSLKNNTLVLELEVNRVIEHKPYAYQLIEGRTVEVPCLYRLKGKVLSFDLPKGYNKNYELVIDPLLVFSAQIGVLADNFGMTATFDAQGNLYSGGVVFDVGYATTTGAYDASFNNVVGYGRTDVFVTKYNSSGNALLYSTYLGGSGTEVASSMVVDQNNNLCLYGATSSTNFPTTAGAAYTNFSGGPTIGFTSNGAIFCGGSDIYISKLSANGASLLASTYYGGTGNDGINHLTATFLDNVNIAFNPCATTFPSTVYDSLQTNYGDQFRGEIQVDDLNNIYIVSSTRSSDIPIVGGFDNSINGAQDVIVAKFNSGLSSLVFSSFYGGSHNDCGNGIYVNKDYEVYISGGTCSSNLAGTSNGYLPGYQGGSTDGFICMIHASGSSIINASYIGTPQYDVSFFVTGDNNNKVFVYGQSYGNMPVQAAPTTTVVYSVPGTHQFVSAYTKTLSSLYMSTVFGSKLTGVDISPSAFAVDRCSNIYISGWGGGIITNTVAMNNMPILNPIPNHGTTTGYDFYLMALDSNATNLVFGSYFGGNQSVEHVDGGTSRFDRTGKIYQSVCAGCGGADDFPITPGAWPCPAGPPCPNQNPSANCNNGVFKLDFQLPLVFSTISTSTVSGCTPLTVTFTNASAPTGTASSYIWHFGNGQTSTSSLNPTFTYNVPGNYTVALVVTDPDACNRKDSSVTYVTALPAPITLFTATSIPCTRSITTQNNSTGTLSATPFVWNFGDGSAAVNATSPPHTYTADGIYNITLITTAANSCTALATNTVAVFNFQPGIATGNTICRGATTLLNASGGTGYIWIPSATLNNSTIASPVAAPQANTIYTVQVLNNTYGQNCNQTLTTQIIVNPTPTTSFNFTNNPCGGGVNYFDQSQNNIVTWTWTLAPNVTSTVQNPYNFYSTGGTYTVSLITTNNFGCQSKFDQLVQVGIPPPVAVSGPAHICYGNSAQLIATGGVTYSWSPANTLDMPASSNPLASPLTSTEYSVLITTSVIVNGAACKFVLTNFVQVTQLSQVPVGAYANPPEVIVGNGSTLIYTGSPGALVTWYPLNSTTPTTGYTVTAYPDKPSTYTAVATLGPCARNVEVRVDAISATCLDTDAFVPNTFTPNSDGNNDMLLVRGLKLDEFYFAVYNRWGELVFETNDRTVGWDGKYKGRPADVGVFGWYLKVRCLNGQEAFKKGNVTLIR